MGASQPLIKAPQYVQEYSAYAVSFAALAPGTTQNGAIQIQADSAFRWYSATLYATIANAAFTRQAQPVPSVNVQIVDTGSGRQLFSQAVPVPSVFGYGDLPFILPVPREFKERSSVQFTVANFDAAVTYNLTLVLIGAKLFLRQ